jgi:hypothetical protein
VEPYVTLEALLRPSIRDAVHQKVLGVPDVPLSEASDPSCLRANLMPTAGTARRSGAQVRERNDVRDCRLYAGIARAIAEEVVPGVPDRFMPKIVEEVRKIVDGESCVSPARAGEESSRGTW